jgi:hypothetical protein
MYHMNSWLHHLSNHSIMFRIFQHVCNPIVGIIKKNSNYFVKMKKNRNRWILLLGPFILCIEQIYGKNRRQKCPATLPFQLREGLSQTYI